MGLFRRRRETYNEQLLREAGFDPNLLLGQPAPVLEPPTSVFAAVGLPDGTGVGPDAWDTCVTVTAPALHGRRIEFTTLPDGDVLVDEQEGSGDVSPLADAVERDVKPPYRAVAARQEDDLWAVGAKRIEVARVAFPEAETLELSRRDSWEELRVDGEPSDAKVPELERLGEGAGQDFFVKAERLDGELWEVRVSAL